MIHFISQLGLKSEPEPGGGEGGIDFWNGGAHVTTLYFLPFFFPFIINLKKGLTGVPVVKKR